MHALVDLLAQLADLALADRGPPHRLNQVINPPGRHAADPGFLDHCDQRLLRALPGFAARGKVAPLPQLRDPQLQFAQPGVEAAVAKAVAPGGALTAALIAAGPDQAVGRGLGKRDRADAPGCTRPTPGDDPRRAAAAASRFRR